MGELFATHMCAPCAAGIFEECENPQVVGIAVDGSEWIIPCAKAFSIAIPVPKERGQVGRPMLEPGEITDVLSTGRKRAAMVMPFFDGQVCAWAGLKFAGGGVLPIVGCSGNTIAQAKTTEEAHELGADEVGHRHHGPDKNVLNNTPGVNLHGICTICHTRWHAINDEFYDEKGRPKNASSPFLPVVAYYFHDGITTANEEDISLAEEWWTLPVKDRGPYPLTPPDDTRMALPSEADDATLDESENPFPDIPFTEIGDSA